MQRERTNDESPRNQSQNDPPATDNLQQMRAELDDIYQHVDQILDSIGYLDGQTFLEQNRQSGGQ